ncbi:MAG: hypothetical protein QNK05_04570 [Myxococcota bacterium]|nr:hypothetical protein [Myxococcota bacterium]
MPDSSPASRRTRTLLLAICLIACLGVGECLDGDGLTISQFRELLARQAAEEVAEVTPEVSVEQCASLPASMPLALDRVPGVANTLIVGNPTPPALIPMNVGDDPASLLGSAPELPADSDGDGVPDVVPPVLDGVVGVNEDLALITTTVNEQVVFADPSDGTLVTGTVDGLARTAISTAVTITPPAGTLDSAGNPFDAPFVATGTTGAAIDSAGTRLFVSMSNIQDDFASNEDPTYGPGVVLVFGIDLSGGTPVIADPDPQVIFTGTTNPTDVVAYAEPAPGVRSFMLVTAAGAVARELGTVGTQPILNFGLAPSAVAAAQASAIEVLEIPAAGDPFVAGVIPLGDSAAGFARVAVDPDDSIGTVGSLLRREVLAFDLRALPMLGLAPVDPPPILDGSTGPDAVIVSTSLTLTPLGTAPPAAICQGSVVGTDWTADGRLVAVEFCDGTVSSWAFDLTTAPVPGIPLPAARISLREEFPAAAPLVPLAVGQLQAPTAIRVRNAPPPANLPDVYLLVGLPEGRLCGIRSDLVL